MLMGACFLWCARPYGRAAGMGLEGPLTPKQRATDVKWNTWIARAFGSGLVAYGGWLLLTH